MAINTLCFATMGAICSGVGEGATVTFGDKVEVAILEDAVVGNISQDIIESGVLEEVLSISVNETELGIVIVEEIL